MLEWSRETIEKNLVQPREGDIQEEPVRDPLKVWKITPPFVGITVRELVLEGRIIRK